MQAEMKGAWDEVEIKQFIRDAKLPLRLACNARDGFPRVVSLWYQYSGGEPISITHKNAQLVSLLQRDSKVGFEIAPNEPPYFGVRGQAEVTLQPLADAATFEALIARYLGGTDSSLATWLLGRNAEEVLITLTPLRFYSWDYRQRMAEAG